MLSIVNKLLQRKTKYMHLLLLIIFSLTMSILMSIIFYKTQLIWISIVLLAQTILGKEKEMEANLTDNPKFKVYQLNKKVQLKFSFFQNLKINPYFYIGLFYTFFSLLSTDLLQFTVALNTIVWLSFYFMLLNDIKPKNRLLYLLIILIIDGFTLKKGYLVITILGLILVMLPNKLKHENRFNLDISRFSKSNRLLFFDNYKLKLYICSAFFIPKLLIF